MSTNFKCDLGDYMAPKLNTLRKHVNPKYTEQKCKVCGKEFETSMQLVSHVASEHIEEKEWYLESISMPKKEGSR